jgi:hypothetical protein
VRAQQENPLFGELQNHAALKLLGIILSRRRPLVLQLGERTERPVLEYAGRGARRRLARHTDTSYSVRATFLLRVGVVSEQDWATLEWDGDA